MSFLNQVQQDLAQEIAAMLTEREQTVAVAESTAGGLISAALLWVPGASRYFTGGGVVYTRNSRVVLGGAAPELFENYQGTTPDMIVAIAEAMRNRLGATWGLAESGLAGPTGGRSGASPGHAVFGVSGPYTGNETIETGSNDREYNMIEFTTHALRVFRDVLHDAADQAPPR